MDCECQQSQVLGSLRHRGVYLFLHFISCDSEAKNLLLSVAGNATGQDGTRHPPRCLTHPLPTPGADPNMVPNALPNLPMLFPASALLEAAAKNTHILFISILFPAYMQGCVCADVRLSAQACGCTSVGTRVCTHPCAYSNCAALFSVRVAAGGC